MSRAYYNEHDPFAAAWLRELIKANLIASGDVDERSIEDVQADDVRGYTQAHFFAGIGGWSYALRLAGWNDDRPVWTGSCPCQPFSGAGKREGGRDDRHLWPHWARLIRECRPVAIFGEQVESAIAHGWLDAVFDDLEREGYACGAACVPAASVGAFHIRQRLWFVADADAARFGTGRPGQACDERDAARIESSGLRHAGDGVGDSGRLQERERHGGIQRDAVGAHARQTAECGSDAGELAEPLHAKRRALDGDRQDGRDGTDAGRPEAHGESGTRGEVRLMADTDGGQSRDRGLQPSGEHRQRAQDGAVSWEDAEWIACIDGKARPIEPGIFPLAYGTSARVGRLRGYGNAIVPQVAAEVIRAYMEIA